jgi:hypothetical protein
MNMREQIESRFRRELDGYRRVGAIASDLWQRHAALPRYDPGRPSTKAVLGLYTLARKRFPAVELLAREGFGQEAMIVARSLANLCIDLGYICKDECDVRARQWMAVGRLSLRDMARKGGVDPGDDRAVDWTAVAAQAKTWKQTHISTRAQAGDLHDLYAYVYQHGSVYEHSDSWSALEVLEFVDDAVELQSDPSPHLCDTALLSSLWSFGQTSAIAAEFWCFPSNGREEILAEIQDSFQAIVKKRDPQFKLGL